MTSLAAEEASLGSVGVAKRWQSRRRKLLDDPLIPVSGLKRENKGLKRENEELKRENEELERKRDELKRDYEEFLFKARGFKTVHGGKVVYSDEIVNEGGGYDHDTGTFTAPVPGNYLFSTSVGSAKDDTITKAHIHVNETWVSTAHSSYTSKGSSFVGVRLKAGDKVFVKAGSAPEDYNKQDMSFAGLLVSSGTDIYCDPHNQCSCKRARIDAPTPLVHFILQTPSLSPDKLLLFADVILNEGGGYDPATGTFIAPVPGTYHFTVTVGSAKKGTVATAHLHVNDTQFCTVHSSYHTSTGSSLITIELKAGDKVYVKAGSPSEDYSICDMCFGGVLESQS